MTSKLQIYIIAFFLIILSIGLITYKVNYLDFPLFDGTKKSVWSIEAKITFKSIENKSAFISLALPKKQKGMYFYNENASSLNFGYTKVNENSYSRGDWSKRSLKKGKYSIYYSIDVIKDENYEVVADNSVIKSKAVVDDDKIEETSSILQATNAIMEEVYKDSSDDLTMTSQLISKFNDDSQVINMIRQKYITNDRELLDLIILLLKSKNVKTRIIGALELIDGKNNASLKPMFEVFHKNAWYLFDIKEGRVNKSDKLFFWQRGDVSLLDTEGVTHSKVRFSITEHIIPAQKASILKNKNQKNSILNYSLFVLPNESQNTFKFLLLIPLGAFVVVLLRIFIGLKTSGTFMPILLAMAFMQTTLLPGIAMFLIVVFIGLTIRSYLSHLNLLLVARISAVLTIVVMIVAVFSVLSYKLGIKQSLTITFFPMIILAWTIERMSILWEEDGAKEVFKQGGGSLLVSIIAYFVMTNSNIEFLVFNFPEFLVTILGFIILSGRYSGYRLSELYRFASLAKESKA
jgi:hypothetical protein